MNKQKTTLGQRLKSLRETYNISQADLASLIGLKGHMGVLKIENGQTLNPQKETLTNIVTVFGTTYEWLVNGKGEMLPDGKVELKSVKETAELNPWQDEAWQMAKSQMDKKDATIEKKDQTIDRLAVSFDRLTEFMSKIDPSVFLYPVGKTGT